MSTVLLVEDDLIILSYLADSLSAYRDDLKILTATHGREALELLRAEPVDLVVTDLNMPVMDGFALIIYLREHYPAMPVIIQTAMSVSEYSGRLQDLGAMRLLQKPVLYKELAQEILDLLARVHQGHISGISLFSFIQLMQWERKTAVLEIKAGANIGHLYFVAGDLVDARYAEREGEAAAYSILAWDHVDIALSSSYKPNRRLITRPLQAILMDANRLKDEASHAAHVALVAASEGARAGTAETPPMSLQMPEQMPVQMPAENAQESWYKEVTPSLEATPSSEREKIMSSVKDTLDSALRIEGAVAAALVDYKSGMSLGSIGTGFNLEVAAAGNTEVVRAKMKVMRALGLKDEIEDILISLSTQYHLIRILPGQGLFLYLVLDREESNLAMARYKLSDLTKAILV